MIKAFIIYNSLGKSRLVKFYDENTCKFTNFIQNFI
jgi:hypothetical protein